MTRWVLNKRMITRIRRAFEWALHRWRQGVAGVVVGAGLLGAVGPNTNLPTPRPAQLLSMSDADPPINLTFDGFRTVPLTVTGAPASGSDGSISISEYPFET